MNQTAKPVRLDRLLSNLGYGVRKDIAALAKAGRITLDGELASKADTKIAPDADLPDRLMIDGAPCDPPFGLVIVMHKALGVTCSHKDKPPLVYDDLPDRWRKRTPAISTIGRLDRETSGLLLLTDDGQFLHNVISPKRHLPKVYRAQLDRPLRDNADAVFAAGELVLEGETKPLMPALLERLSSTDVRLTIHEGRYHQVRRMFAAVDNHVTALHRERIGGLTLPNDLEPGDWRILSDEEKDALFQS